MVSHVWPFPGRSGQQSRVRYLLEAAGRAFEVDFLSFAPAAELNGRRVQTGPMCRRCIALPSRRRGRGVGRIIQGASRLLFQARTGLKGSNYDIGRMDLSPARVLSAVNPAAYACVFFEYFHAHETAYGFRAAGVPAVLDMHNVLWKGVEQRLAEDRRVPAWLQHVCVGRYKAQEERAWQSFDALIAINRREEEMVRAQLRADQSLFFLPMGIDLGQWSCCWRPATPPRVAYYGSLGSPHNEAAALRCHERIMPALWRQWPGAELWLIGSDPGPRLRALESDKRVRVTGFVEDVRQVLSTTSLVLCPWEGTYGFRSRIIEVMALGVPVVATPAAVDGMELSDGDGILFGLTDSELATCAARLLGDAGHAKDQSARARSCVERLYSVQGTYDRFMGELKRWLRSR
jgi:glycosyltransferase involved in cell wall biosynthesis